MGSARWPQRRWLALFWSIAVRLAMGAGSGAGAPRDRNTAQPRFCVALDGRADLGRRRLRAPHRAAASCLRADRVRRRHRRRLRRLPPAPGPPRVGRRGLRRSLGPEADDGGGRSLARRAPPAAAGRRIARSALAALPGARGHRCRRAHLRPGRISSPASPGRRRAVGHRQRPQCTQQQHRPSRRAGGRWVALCRRGTAGGGHRRRGEFRPLGGAHHGHPDQRATRARRSRGRGIGVGQDGSRVAGRVAACRPGSSAANHLHCHRARHAR